MLRIKVVDVIGFKVLIEEFVFIVTYFQRMQPSIFIGAFMQPFPHFDAGNVRETGFVDELYIYIHYMMFQFTNTVVLNL